MTVKRTRAAVAAAVLSILTLAGCAVPGLGEPGVAVEYGDRVVTYGDLEMVASALDGLGSIDNPGEAATLALLGPSAVEIAAAYGFEYDDDSMRSQALLWQSAEQRQTQTEPTEDMKLVVFWVLALTFCHFSEEASEELFAVIEDVEATAVTSPRVGEFTAQNYLTALSQVGTEYNNRGAEFGPAAFIFFANLNGFYSALPPTDWTSFREDADAVA